MPDPVPAYVVDTSYLLEIYQVPGSSNQERRAEVLKRLKDAQGHGASFFVTIGCIFEVGAHIAHASDSRHGLAARLRDDVTKGLRTGVPWTILRTDSDPEIADLLGSFPDLAQQGLSLADAEVVAEAKRLRSQYTTLKPVHIWTLDKALKAREPDREPHAYVG